MSYRAETRRVRRRGTDRVETVVAVVDEGGRIVRTYPKDYGARARKLAAALNVEAAEREAREQGETNGG